MLMENLIVERIEKNKNIFTEEELLKIKSNYDILVKVYILGLIDGQTYNFLTKK